MSDSTIMGQEVEEMNNSQKRLNKGVELARKGLVSAHSQLERQIIRSEAITKNLLDERKKLDVNTEEQQRNIELLEKTQSEIKEAVSKQEDIKDMLKSLVNIAVV